jgi:phosphoribosyl 1,2-cyclic phosphodiesterase
LTLRFSALASGSRGNALLVEHDETLVMVDCGLPLRTLDERLAAVGRTAAEIDAVLVTHEHGDHSRGLRAFSRQYPAPIYTTPGTARAVDAIDAYERLGFGREFRIGSIRIEPFSVPHDAREPCQFAFSAGGRRLGVLTDTGHATPPIRRALENCNALAIEFNHDTWMLDNGSYPESVKARVGSRLGHLNNEQAADLLDELRHANLQWIVGLHLSERNNSPARVRAAAARVTDRSGVELRLAAQDEPTGWIDIA